MHKHTYISQLSPPAPLSLRPPISVRPCLSQVSLPVHSGSAVAMGPPVAPCHYHKAGDVPPSFGHTGVCKPCLPVTEMGPAESADASQPPAAVTTQPSNAGTCGG
ncbi:hypothetical protein KIL84_015043 [Mauremys mutica]|uniref:Uncharacterized protein n=1 Tax=Mauremys mutica TaxID=74926 RepID=A0A9D3XRB5_9SAUR|nr:hypothetical protein KIL84_015043 [Mauremys mutica]